MTRWWIVAALLTLGCVHDIRVPIRVTAQGDPVDVIEGCREICLRSCDGQIWTNTGQDVKAAIVLPDRKVGCVCRPFEL